MLHLQSLDMVSLYQNSETLCEHDTQAVVAPDGYGAVHLHQHMKDLREDYKDCQYHLVHQMDSSY